MLVSLPLITLAQQQTSAEIQTLKVQGNLYLLTGAGSNIAVQIGDTGVLVVDTGKAETAEKVVAAIRRLSDKPIQYIVNTHMHADHTVETMSSVRPALPTLAPTSPVISPMRESERRSMRTTMY